MRELTCELLTPIMRAHFGDGANCAQVTRGPVGNGQETWFLEVTGPGGPRRLVLRRTATDGPMSYTDRGEEFDALRTAAALGLPVPAAHWYEASGTDLDRPYFVMERMPGGPLLGGEGRDVLDAVASELGGHLARLHTIGGGGLLSAAEATRRELATWRRRYFATRPGPVPLLGALLAWLESNLPDLEGEAVFNWGDPGPHNLLVEGGRITGLLDWEMSHQGHPLEDLGVAVWSCLGLLDPERLIAGYEEGSDRPVDRGLLAYFEVLAGVERGIAIEIGVTAFVEGRITTPVPAGLGLELQSANLLRTAAAAGWGTIAAPHLDQVAASAGLAPSPAQAARGVGRLLETDLLPTVTDRRLRRLLKNAAALLAASAVRLDSEPALQGWRSATFESLLADLRAAGIIAVDVEEAAMAVESDPGLAGWRPRVRRTLLAEMAAERADFGALRVLYGTSAGMPPLTGLIGTSRSGPG